MFVLVIVVLIVVYFLFDKPIASHFSAFQFTVFVGFCCNAPTIKNIVVRFSIDFLFVAEAQRVIFIFNDVAVFCCDLSCSVVYVVLVCCCTFAACFLYKTNSCNIIGRNIKISLPIIFK